MPGPDPDSTNAIDQVTPFGEGEKKIHELNVTAYFEWLRPSLQ